MLKKILSLLLILFLLIVIPNNVKGNEVEYIPLITFTDNTLGVFGNPTTYFTIVSEDGNNVMKSTGTLKTLWWTSSPSTQYPSFDLSFKFKVASISSNTQYDLFCYKSNSSYVWGLKISIQYANNGGVGGYLYVSNQNTTQFVPYNIWHTMFVNVTSITQVRYSLDGASLSTPYTMAANPTNGRYGMGATYTSGGGTVYWDNIVLATRTGSIPNTSFDYYPNSGDGLTNFIFNDTSIYDSIPFDNIVVWDFGDGNTTISGPGSSVNHTYIHAGTYQIVLNCSNRLGYDLAYTNITVSDISIGGSEFMSDTMFGFALVVGLITVMNYIGIKLRFLMLSLFAFLSMFFAIGLLWQNDNVYITLMICMVLSNIALLVYGFTKD